MFPSYLIGINRKKIFLILLFTSIIILVYSSKQYFQFGTFSTSTFSGLNLNKSVGNFSILEYSKYLDKQTIRDNKSELPRVLVRTNKIDGSRNFNHYSYLDFNLFLVNKYKNYIFSTPPLELLVNYLHNLWLYFKPSSMFGKHVIVDAIPWRPMFDLVFSFPILNILILLFGIDWVLNNFKSKDKFAIIGFALPGIFIFIVSILFEKWENMRYKFYLEPLVIIFIISQISIRFEKSFQKMCLLWREQSVR